MGKAPTLRSENIILHLSPLAGALYQCNVLSFFSYCYLFILIFKNQNNIIKASHSNGISPFPHRKHESFIDRTVIVNISFSGNEISQFHCYNARSLINDGNFIPNLIFMLVWEAYNFIMSLFFLF